jgi:hypothetical protein
MLAVASAPGMAAINPGADAMRERIRRETEY